MAAKRRKRETEIEASPAVQQAIESQRAAAAKGDAETGVCPVGAAALVVAGAALGGVAGAGAAAGAVGAAT
jgi:hypothetical protein